MAAVDDHFSLFGLPARFQIDAGALEQAWRAVAARVHPDRYATASPAERRVAMQWSARANEAYRQLRDPLLRARYLCEQAGVDLQTESNTSMDADFLMQQMTWREMLDDVREQGGAGTATSTLRAELQDAEAAFQREVSRLLDDQNDPAGAATKIREWMFVRKLLQELAQATD
ncbi:Fe-S protein assembly co-chaperone HscB [Bordetella genomosp. 11]|uniref:Co-chaperone protein HscB homolog n=1 Tax=Bordetella genomosp. 11 TaxID=1416808 RepID=A0A261UH11_9BORD|nr:Fe-S protein assembly co-chaperone HscB [Bordetella genomosp. 11]OZI61229.1 Fe-S protein assembly co-chaperone HscB [Bordetella genomosp. 11]